MKTISIPHGFQTFLSAIEPTAKQRKDANEQHIRLREQLQKRMRVRENFLSGSYKRKTAVRPLGDIDVFLVLEAERGFDPTVPATKVLGELKRVLDEIYPNKAARLQNRSVNIAFSKTGVSYDVVPAFVMQGREDVYSTPDRQTGRWVRTNPKLHAKLATEANDRAGKKLKPLIKAVKAANLHHRKPARSFHLEVLSWRIITSDPGPYLVGLVRLLEGLAKRIIAPCADPAGLSPDIHPQPIEVDTAQMWLTHMAELAAQAKELDDAKQTSAAHAKLRELFGPQW
ncbi:MAG: nucleotidyltransferase domain-containing protein [Myxococcales bacterium]|nr:nucleotidyltransferase domain-containing protein [Myxococcales bacterium]